MPNQHSTLTGLFTDIASAIREKDGSSTPIIADAFPSAIRAIPSGGGGDHDAEDGIIMRTISGEYVNSRATKVGNFAFTTCIDLTSISFPVCTSIGGSAFNACIGLISISFPVCTSISDYAFAGCGNLTSISFPACTYIGGSAFIRCGNLISISFPACTSIGVYAFAYCSGLTSISFPACMHIGGSAFYSCYNLTSISFPACTSIGSNAFAWCYNLLSVYLYASSVCRLLYSNAFSSTPIAGYTASTSGVYGSIYVPMSLLSAYQASTNWVRFSSRFVGVNPEDM